jgi:hypothetical protein
LAYSSPEYNIYANPRLSSLFCNTAIRNAGFEERREDKSNMHHDYGTNEAESIGQ